MEVKSIVSILDRDEVLDLESNEKTLSENEYQCEIDMELFSDSDQWELPGYILEELTSTVGQKINSISSEENWPEQITRGDSGIWDTCAWYQPIHFFAYDWGIYIREDCLIKLAKSISSYVDPGALRFLGTQLFSKSVLRAAFQAFYLHEHFHHKVESFGIRLHISQGLKSKYLPYKKMFTDQTCIATSVLKRHWQMRTPIDA